MASVSNPNTECVATKLTEIESENKVYDIWDQYNNIAVLEHNGHDIKVNVVKGCFEHV